MHKLLFVSLTLFFVVSITQSGKSRELTVLQDPVGLYVHGANDSVTTAVLELALLYLKTRGHDPVKLNELWKDKRKLHEKRAIRKRAARSGMTSLIYLDIQPADKNEKYRLYRKGYRTWLPTGVKFKRELFQLSLGADIYSDAKRRLPDHKAGYKSAVHISTELSLFGLKSDFFNYSEPVMRMFGEAIDSLLVVIPEKPDSAEPVYGVIPATIVCDRGFESHYGRDEWVKEMAKQIYMANLILAENLNVVLNVQTSMIYDIPSEVESMGDLLRHLRSEEFKVPKGVWVFFSSQNLEFDRKSVMSLGLLGLSSLVGRRTVVAGYPLHEDESEPWDYLFESLIIVHEVGHMLGAVHTNDHKSLMYPIANIVTPVFDSRNKERITRFLPLFVGGECFVENLSYHQMIDSLLAIYPDTSEMVNALTGVLYDYQQDRRYAREEKDLGEDYFYNIASGIRLLTHGIDDAARDKFVHALDLGPGYSELYLGIAHLYYEADSLETSCKYLDMAREAGYPVPEFEMCDESRDKVNDTDAGDEDK
ncbi:MAG: matrixin family metalloprotease [candidate division Zixibacteria bacterium]|nr:matrixin family metalloprotease [candidate division Zixibacteria bacterium]